MGRFIKWVSIVLVALAAILLVGLMAFGRSDHFSKGELEILAQRLNEAAAIQIPHHFLMPDATRNRHRKLLEQVESGAVLSEEYSARYRLIFQDNLKNNQTFLARFDGELTILKDWSLTVGNNVESTGIAGAHDHHDRSARRNYADLERALTALDNAHGITASVQRIRAINLAYKSIADIISHLGVAPHTVSVPYRDPTEPWSHRELGARFEGVLKAYKSAQFLPVNGVHYWREVRRAVEGYAALVEAVQARIHARSSWVERRIAGRFLAIQTLAPQIDEDIPMRARPQIP